MRNRPFPCWFNFWMHPLKHVQHLFAADPERVFNLLGIKYDILVECLTSTPEHQRRRKRPRLAGEIADLPNPNTRFFKNLPTHRGLQCLTRFHKTRQERIHAFRPGMRTPHQHFVFMRNQHDHHRISPRKMRTITGGAIALPPRHRHI